MPLPVKTKFLRGGKSVTVSDDSFSSCHRGSGFSNLSLSDTGGAQVHSSGMIDGYTEPKWNPRYSMAFNSAKGLLNPVGENNCFLNSAVQILWHLDVFRRNFRLYSGHVCSGSSCIFCALKAVFTQYQFSERPALPADTLRRALAHTFADQQRFQMGLMDDASECFENILSQMHFHVVPDQSDDDCQAAHCLSHQKFMMKVKEQVVCQCHSPSGELLFNQTVHHIATTALMTQVQNSRAQRSKGKIVSFGQLLKDAKSDGEARKCSANCGRMAVIHRTLTNSPEVISIGFIWDSERPSFEHIRGVVSAISTELQTQDLFDSVCDSQYGSNETLKLVGIVCYYCRHYSTFLFHSKMKTWVLFDDANILEMGPDWRSVADRCCQGHYQPLLLLYSKENTCLIDPSTAPLTTHMQKKPDCHKLELNQQPYTVSCVPDLYDYQRLTESCYDIVRPSTKSDKKFMDTRDSATSLLSLSNKSTASSWTEEVDRQNHDSDSVDLDSSNAGRQPSYLYAITGTNSFYKDKSYNSYLSAISDASNFHKRHSLEKSSTQSDRDKIRNEHRTGDKNAMKCNPSNSNKKSVSFSSRPNGVLPSRGTGSFKTSDSVNERGKHNSLPRSLESDPYLSYQSVTCNSSSGSLVGTGWNSQPNVAADYKPVVASSSKLAMVAGKGAVPSLAGKEHGNTTSKNSNWMNDTEEDGATFGNEYISAKKVQNVLRSQGVQARRGRNKGNVMLNVQKRQETHQNHAAQNRMGFYVPELESRHYGTHGLGDSLENVSLGSHKDSGYRSGDNDQSSSNSVPSSPSLESGVFLPSRNAQLIAEDFLKSNSQEWPEGAHFSSLESLSSSFSSQRSGIANAHRKQRMDTIPETDCSTTASSRMNPNQGGIQVGPLRVSDSGWLLSEVDRLSMRVRKLMSAQDNTQALKCISQAKGVLDAVSRTGKSESELRSIKRHHQELSSLQNKLLLALEQKSNSSTISCDDSNSVNSKSSIWNEDQDLRQSSRGDCAMPTYGDNLSQFGSFKRIAVNGQSNIITEQDSRKPTAYSHDIGLRSEGQRLEVTGIQKHPKQESVSLGSRRDLR